MEVKIERLGMNGEGVFVVPEGENCGKVGFVSFALPNEIVEVDITKSKSSFCNAKLNKILKESDVRKTPECPYFTICGGCDLLHMNEQSQIAFKQNKVKETIAKIAKIDVKIDEVVHLNNYNYRNKMVFPFGYKNGQITLGMYEKSSRNVVEIDKCLLASDGINQILGYSQEYFKKSNLSVYNNKTKRGVLKHLVVRQFEEDYLITLVVSKKIDTSKYYDYLSKYFKNIGISIIIGDSDDEILSGEYRYQHGLQALNLNEFGIGYNLDNRGFLQINNVIKEAAYNKILDNIQSTDIVIDAYGGAGLLSSIIAKKCKKVVGIEINASASKSAQEMAKINNLHNTMFINADVKDVISEILDDNPNCVLVLDPTRSGCEDIVLDKILASNLPKKIIYLSCNVATLARDINKLNSYYDISSVIALDMFPNTKHVETLVVINRIDKSLKKL